MIGSRVIISYCKYHHGNTKVCKLVSTLVISWDLLHHHGVHPLGSDSFTVYLLSIGSLLTVAAGRVLPPVGESLPPFPPHFDHEMVYRLVHTGS